MGRQDSFIDIEACHSPTPVFEWQKTDLQPTHRLLSQNVRNMAEMRALDIGQVTPVNKPFA